MNIGLRNRFVHSALLVLALSMCICNTGCPPAKNVTLTADSAKTVYATGEPIDISLTLTNTGTSVVNLSRLLDGNITISSLTRNGAVVPAASEDIRYEMDLATILKDSVVAVNPGQDVSIRLTSYSYDKLGGQVLRTVKYQPSDRHKALLRQVNQPGSYNLALVYKYAGPSSPGVFSSETNVAHIAFTVTP